MQRYNVTITGLIRLSSSSVLIRPAVLTGLVNAIFGDITVIYLAIQDEWITGAIRASSE